MVDLRKEYGVMKDFKHLYFFDYTPTNHRMVRLFPMADLIGKEIDVSELEGILFAQKEIPEQQQKFPITNFEEILKEYSGRVIYFEDFKKY